MTSVFFAEGSATVEGFPAGQMLAEGIAHAQAVSTTAPFTQLRSSGAPIQKMYVGAEHVNRVYYGPFLVAFFGVVEESVFESAGVAGADGIGAATTGIAASDGIATAEAVSFSSAIADGVSDGTSNAVGVSEGAAASEGASDGVATAAAVSEATAAPQSLLFAASSSCLHVAQNTSSPNRRTFTLSAWVKFASFSAQAHDVLAIDLDDNNFLDAMIEYGTDRALGGFEDQTGTTRMDEDTLNNVVTVNTWHHLVMRYDSTNATADDRFRMYVDGVLKSNTTGDHTPDLNHQFMMFHTGHVVIGAGSADGSVIPIRVNSRIAFVDAIEGQSLLPTSFAFNNGGIWTRKKYTGSYGTNGWSLDGSNDFNSTAGKAYLFEEVGTINMDADLPPYTN